MSLDRTDGILCLDGVRLDEVADRFGTPTYVYSWTNIEARYRDLARALADTRHRICYSVKANSNLAILHHLSELGANFDIVSGGELERLMVVGISPSQAIFSGVGKSVAEIDFALKAGIGCINMESTAELERIEARSGLLGKIAPVSVRLNPDVDANTHPYISTGLRKNKFGVAETEAIEMCHYAHKSESLKIFGLGCHIGSQINQTAPFIEALDHLIRLTHQLSDEGIELAHLDLGGGLGIRYADEEELDIASYAAAVSEKLEGLNVELLIEPGRYLVAEAGLLLTRVEYLKPSRVADQPNYAVVDAAMNDLIRPALYQAYHQVLSVGADAIDSCRWDIVGPICESGDFLALQRDLDLSEGSLLAILSTGAYGFVQSSNYNTRARSAEVMIRSNELQLVRDRESISDLLRLERIL